MNAQEKDLALALKIEARTDTPKRWRGDQWNGRDKCKAAARTLRRAQMTLRRWAELECGTERGHIERLEQLDGITRPVYVPDWRGRGPGGISPHVVPDREAGALRRVAKVCKDAGLHYYHQTDPRGCALYVSAEVLTSQNYSSKGIACL